ncbi:MAG: hypothetical protein GY756_15395, partial [bacterium]|nr:hypothetical protein [bacterium]
IADIFYKAAIGNKNFTSKIRVVENNKLSILDEDSISGKEYHLDLSVEYQNFVFNQDNNSLSITGSSPKVNGDYYIHISNLKPSTL